MISIPKAYSSRHSSSHRRQAGVTLLEITLVITIISAIIILSIQQVSIYRRAANVQQVQSDVDKLFSAMSLYYQQNCYGTYDKVNGFTRASLYPNPNGPQVVTVDINNDLINSGFLTSNVSQINPLLNDNASVTSGGSSSTTVTNVTYVLQFNRDAYTTQPKTVCISGTPGNCTTANVGTIYLWKAQVAVLLNENMGNNDTQYLTMLGGDCLSSYSNGSVTPCSQGGQSNQQNPSDYVVWERLPSIGRAGSFTNQWATMPTVNQFKQMYTTYQVNYLIGSGGTTPPRGTSTPQYYLCGG